MQSGLCQHAACLIQVQRAGSSEIKCKPRQEFGCLDFFCFLFFPLFLPSLYLVDFFFFNSQAWSSLTLFLRSILNWIIQLGAVEDQKMDLDDKGSKDNPLEYWDMSDPRSFGLLLAQRPILNFFSICCKLSTWRIQRRAVEGAWKLSKALTQSRYTEYTELFPDLQRKRTSVISKNPTNL